MTSPADAARLPTGTPLPDIDRPTARAQHRMAVEMFWADLSRLLETPDSLDPDSLVGFAGSQLHNIDSQIVAARNNIAQRDRRSRALSAALDGVTRWHAAHQNVSRTSRDALHLNGANTAVDPETGGPCSILDLLQRAGVDLHRLPNEGRDPTYGSDNPSDLEGLRSTLQRAIEDNNRGSEQDTLQMQALVNRRGQIIQLTTNLMSALHESAKSILQNMRA